jgi:hypothetical protein
MSLQGIKSTTITLADGPNDLRPVLSGLAEGRPDLVKLLPSITSLWEETYELSPEGVTAIAEAISRGLP